MRKLLLFLLFTVPLFGQVSNPAIVVVTTTPGGSCSKNLPDEQVATTGLLYSCQSGAWSLVGITGSTGFPITIGSTNIGSGSTTTTLAGLTLTAPNLGTPSTLVLTHATGTPASIGLANGTGLPWTGITGTPSTTQVPFQSLTTTGSSGAATLSGGVLNIPQYSGGTTTSALTLNNSGSGASSGATFNGSAAVTLSYNTIGAQQALTLTTTGSSGAATLSGGTLNIPQYTGGGGSNAAIVFSPVNVPLGKMILVNASSPIVLD